MKKPKWICDREVCGMLQCIENMGEYENTEIFLNGRVKHKFSLKNYLSEDAGERGRSWVSLNITLS